MSHTLPKEHKSHLLLWAFCLGLLTAGLFMLPAMVQRGGLYALMGDYNYEQVPFIMYITQAIKSGHVWWAGGADLGTGYLAALSFYNATSPFALLACLVPAKWLPYANGWLLMLKFALCAVTACAYARRHVRGTHAALAAALLYAFSGFQAGTLNYPFQDVLVFFPLLLLALEATMEDDAHGVFAAMAALSAFMNYYFFIGQVVFLTLYFAVRCFGGGWRLTRGKFAQLALESVLGTALACVVFIPNILFVLQNPRVADDAGWQSLKTMLLAHPLNFSNILRGLLLPAENIQNRSMFTAVDASSAELYLPLVGCIPAFSWLWAHKKSWQARLAAVLAVFAFVPVLNSLFVALNSAYYARWFYMPVLLAAVLSAAALEQGVSLKPGGIFAACVAAFLLVNKYIWKYYYGNGGYIVNGLLAAVFCAIGLAGAVLTLVAVPRLWKTLRGKNAVLAGIVLFSAATMWLNQYYCQKSDTPAGENLREYATVLPTVTLPQDGWYRMDAANAYTNMGIVTAVGSPRAFNSTVSAGVFRFYQGMGIPRSVTSNPPQAQYGIAALLGCRYALAADRFGGCALPDATALYSEQGFTVYSYPHALYMGAAFDSYMTESEFAALAGEKHLALTQVLVVPDADAAQLNGTLRHVATQEMQAQLNADAFKQGAAARNAVHAQTFAETARGYTATANLEEAAVLFFSIPNDSGWKITVNGEAVQPLTADFGFMALACPAGQVDITFTYTPPGFAAGCAASAIGALGLAAYALWRHKKKKDARSV